MQIAVNICCLAPNINNGQRKMRLIVTKSRLCILPQLSNDPTITIEGVDVVRLVSNLGITICDNDTYSS